MNDPTPRPKVTAVVPVFNSSGLLVDLVRRLSAVLTQVSTSWEIVLVNDGSRDHSWDVVQALAKADPVHVRGFDLMRNYGQHNATLTGIHHAQGELIVTLDDDAQFPPEAIPHLLAALTADVDVVYGLPIRDAHGLGRRIVSILAKVLLRHAFGAHGIEQTSSFRLFRSTLRSAFRHHAGPDADVDALLTWGTERFAVVPIAHAARPSGRSTYTTGRLLRHTFNMLTGFSVLPLSFASWLGFCLTLFGAVVLIFVVGRYLIQGCSVPGFPFLASIIAVFSGAQLFAVGLIGAYLARIHFRVMRRPGAVVRRQTPTPPPA